MTVKELLPKKRRSAASQVLSKVGISAVFGGLAFLLSQAFDSAAEGKVVLGIGLSVFISGVAFVTQYLVEVDGRVETNNTELRGVRDSYNNHADRTRQLIKDEFAKINEATRLFGAVEASALNTDVMTQLVRNSTTIPKRTPSLIFDFAQSEIGLLSAYLKDLGQGGDVTYEGEDRNWLLGLTRVAAISIDATSLTTVDAGGGKYVDGGLWSSNLGHLYLDAQREAIERGVKIRRIFIIDRPALQNDRGLLEVMRQHENAGVQVQILNADEVTGTRLASLFDFIVIDGVLCYQSTTAARAGEQSRPIIVTTTLVTNGARVRDRIERYRGLWEAAHPFDEPILRVA